MGPPASCSLFCPFISATLLCPLWLQGWQPTELQSLATWHMLWSRILFWLAVTLNHCSGENLPVAAGVNESYIALEQVMGIPVLREYL